MSNLKPCGECGMLCDPAEYHPYTACLLFKQIGDARATRDVLNAAVFEHARETFAATPLADAQPRLMDGIAIDKSVVKRLAAQFGLSLVDAQSGERAVLEEAAVLCSELSQKYTLETMGALQEAAGIIRTRLRRGSLKVALEYINRTAQAVSTTASELTDERLEELASQSGLYGVRRAAAAYARVVLREAGSASTMPALTDAMRAVLRNESGAYGSEDELYAALCAVTGSASADDSENRDHDRSSATND